MKSLPLTWKTDRMLLRKPTLADFRQVYRILQNPTVMRYVTTGARSKSEALAEVKGWLAHWQQHGFGSYLAIDDRNNNVMGFAKLYLSDRSEFLQLGYALDEPYWHQGLGTELARACLDLGFSQLAQPQLDAFARIENKASRHLLEKLGMRCLTDNFVYANRPYAHYGINRAEYFSYSLEYTRKAS